MSALLSTISNFHWSILNDKVSKFIAKKIKSGPQAVQFFNSLSPRRSQGHIFEKDNKAELAPEPETSAHQVLIFPSANATCSKGEGEAL